MKTRKILIVTGSIVIISVLLAICLARTTVECETEAYTKDLVPVKIEIKASYWFGHWDKFTKSFIEINLQHYAKIAIADISYKDIKIGNIDLNYDKNEIMRFGNGDKIKVNFEVTEIGQVVN